MALTLSAERAYLEAFQRRARGRPSLRWRGDEDLVEVWMDAFVVGAEEHISPWDALLRVVHHRAARVRWVDSVIATIISREQRAHAADPDVGPAQQDDYTPSGEVQEWLDISRREGILLSRAAKMALDAGLQRALVERKQREGQVVVDALIAGLDALELAPEQRQLALETAHVRLMGEGPAGMIGGQHLHDDLDDL